MVYNFYNPRSVFFSFKDKVERTMNRAENAPMSSNGRVRYGPGMRVLIVGAGVAGLTLCGLLQQRGFQPTLVERAPEFGDVGYVIVVWPSGSRILKGLGLYERLQEQGCAFTSYNISNYRGKVINSYTIDSVVEKYGPIISIYRPDLIDILRAAVSEDSIRMNTMVVSLEDTGTGSRRCSATEARGPTISL